MHLEQLRDAEEAKRKGQARRTLLQTIWLLITGSGAYVLTSLLLAQNENLYATLYRQFSIPTWVPTAVVFWAIVIIIVLLMQLIFLLVFITASSEGRRRPGTPSLYSRNKDPLDDRF
ncbi:MAG: hypothetical protein KDE56_08595 [Anaerolineales bacterium]|nr:hypothetical protein [Anaerolineales bacterium]